MEMEDTIDFTVVYNKQRLPVSLAHDSTILELKEHIKDLIGVPSAMQKIVYKGKYSSWSAERHSNLEYLTSWLCSCTTLHCALYSWISRHFYLCPVFPINWTRYTLNSVNYLRTELAYQLIDTYFEKTVHSLWSYRNSVSNALFTMFYCFFLCL